MLLAWLLSLLTFFFLCLQIQWLRHTGTQPLQADCLLQKINETNAVPYAYTISLAVQIHLLEYAGKVDIRFSVNKPTNQISFHSKKHRFKSILLDSLPVQSVSCCSDICTLALDQPLKAHKNHSLSITYFAKIAQDALNGFYTSKYTTSDGIQHSMAVTQLEPTSARRVFPCFDLPHLKATFQLNIAASKEYTVVSNMPVKTTKNHKDGMLHVFHTSPKMSTYLVAFTISKLKSVTRKHQRQNSSVDISVFYLPGTKKSAEVALNSAIKALGCYERMFQYPYMLPKLDLFPIPDFGGEGMENWGLLTFEDRLLLLTQNATEIAKATTHLLIAHEIAHQWFGNLITMSSWSQLFFNEGFAEFFQYHCAAFPVSDIDFFFQENLLAFQADVFSSHALTPRKKYTNHPSAMFDDVTYDKGASILRMMQSFLGSKTLQDCGVLCDRLSIILHRNAYGLFDVNTFWDVFEDLNWVKSWLEQPGYPVLKVETTKNNDVCDIRIQQSQFGGGNSTWDIVLSWKWVDGSGENEKPALMFSDSQITIQERCSDSGTFIFNLDRTSLVRISYTAEYVLHYARLWDNVSKHVSMSDRAGFVSDLLYLYTTNYLEKRGDDSWIFQCLRHIMERETNSGIWRIFANDWSLLSYVLSRHRVYTKFVQYTTHLIKERVETLGWVSYDSEETRQIQGILLDLCVHHRCSDEIIAKGLRLYKRIEKVSNDILPSLYKNALLYSEDPVATYRQLYEFFTDGLEKKRKDTLPLLLIALIHSRNARCQSMTLGLFSKTSAYATLIPQQYLIPTLEGLAQSTGEFQRVFWWLAKEWRGALWKYEIGKAKLNRLFENIVSGLLDPQALDTVEGLAGDVAFETVKMGMERGVLKARERLLFLQNVIDI